MDVTSFLLGFVMIPAIGGLACVAWMIKDNWRAIGAFSLSRVTKLASFEAVIDRRDDGGMKVNTTIGHSRAAAAAAMALARDLRWVGKRWVVVNANAGMTDHGSDFATLTNLIADFRLSQPEADKAPQTDDAGDAKEAGTRPAND